MSSEVKNNDDIVDSLSKTSIVISGKDLLSLDDEELQKVVEYDEIVFARMSPDQKLRIVKAFQKAGYCVGMTGDGVNDAPSLVCVDQINKNRCILHSLLFLETSRYWYCDGKWECSCNCTNYFWNRSYLP